MDTCLLSVKKSKKKWKLSLTRRYSPLYEIGGLLQQLLPGSVRAFGIVRQCAVAMLDFASSYTPRRVSKVSKIEKHTSEQTRGANHEAQNLLIEVARTCRYHSSTRTALIEASLQKELQKERSC